MHHRNSIKISQHTLPSQPKLIMYDNLSKKELIDLVRQRDQELASDKEYIKAVQNQYNQKMAMLRLKIEDEIAQTEKAVKAFGNITEIIITIIAKFQGFDRIADRESLVSIAHTIRSSIISKAGSLSNSLQENLNESEFSCIDEITTETIRLLEYLSQLTEDMIKMNIKLKTQFTTRMKPIQHKSEHFSKIKKIPRQDQSKIKQPPRIQKQFSQEEELSPKDSGRLADSIIKSWNEQIASLKEQAKLKFNEAKKFKKLLQQQQQRRLEILRNIASSLSEQLFVKVTSMNRDELIEHIKMMSYRIRELEKDKREQFAKSKIQREVDQRKFQDLLEQVKEFKLRRNNLSLA